ncbi:MAG TPA: NUDIX domain-containing protein [Paenibacillus sp.]|jgi:ADP-ribose pyrophosphatase YjhB (NUDIX family)
MRLIREIEDIDIEREELINSNFAYTVRKASRAVVTNSSKEMALIYVSRDKYHKLPGGGLEKDEDYMTALTRELIEEAGVEVRILDEVGMIIEYRNEHRLLQISYCYLGEVADKWVEPSYTQEERNQGYILKWVHIEEAISLLENDHPKNYVGKFIKERDLTFVKEVARTIS